MLKNGEISPSGLMMLVVGFLLGSSLLFMPGQAAKQDTWAAITLGTIEGIAVSLLYCGLASRFRHETLPQICTEVYGRYLGTVVGALYLWFLFHLGSLATGTFEDFVSTVLLPKTPESVILAVLVVVVTVVVGYGLGAMARCAQVIVTYVLFVVCLTVLMLLPSFRWARLQPMLATPLPKLLYFGHATASYPFNEAVAFMMVLPFVRGKIGSTAMVRPLLLAGLFLVLGAFRNTGVLGALSPVQVYSSYAAVRLIDLAGFFTRLESLVAINFLATAFIKVTLLLYGVSLGLAQMLGLKSYRSIVLPVGIFMAALSTVNFDNIGQNIALADRGWPVYAPIFQIGIPALTLLVALVRGLPAREGGGA